MVSTVPNIPAPMQLLNEQQTGARLSLSASYLRKLRSGVCKPPVGFPVARKIGRVVRYALADIEKFIAGPAPEVTQ